MPAKKGRPLEHQDVAMDVYSVRLPTWHAIRARKMGGGVLSDGIRIAIEKALKEMRELDDQINNPR